MSERSELIGWLGERKRPTAWRPCERGEAGS